MKKYCDHVLALKTERVSNFIKKTYVRCSFKDHVSPQYNLCLNCGETRCSQNEVNEESCSYKHWNTNKHPIVLQIISLKIYCFACSAYVLDFEMDVITKVEKRKIEKIIESHEKIIQIAKKLLTDSKMEKALKTHKKIENPRQSSPTLKNKQSRKQHSKNTNLRAFGLTNIGNTCYLNSVLQCLYATPEIHQFYSNCEPKDDFNLIFKKLLKNNEKVYCPKSLFSRICKDHKNFKGLHQQDAFELFVFLINSLIQSATKYKETQGQSLGTLFGFTLTSKLECLNCSQIRWIKDFSLGLCIPLTRKGKKNIEKIEEKYVDLEIPQEAIGEPKLYQTAYKPTNTFLDWFFSPELFNQTNEYCCENCKQSNAIHRFFLKDPPPILVINFKRFHNSGAKNDANINIPPQISIDCFCLNKEQELTYEIYGAVIHNGSSRAGHYIAYTKRNNDWVYFSDQHFKQANFTGMKNSNPYIVFYRRIEQVAFQEEQMKKEESCSKKQEQ